MKGSGTVRVGRVVVQEVGARLSGTQSAGILRPAGEARGERECRGEAVGGGEGGEEKGEIGGIRCG